MELYVHIPFCKQKCRYCAFTSFTGQEAYFQRYIDLLLNEARNRKDEVSEPFTTVYIGGGTPSVLTPEQFSYMINGLRSVFDLKHVIEFSTEANPGTVTAKWLDTALSLGVNRLSFGVQSYQEKLLRLLGRIHSFGDVVSSFSAARKAGFRNIGVDLIFGIPTQTMEDWKRTIDSVLSMQPEHISAYGLIPEEGTSIYADLQKQLLSLPEPEEERRMYDHIISRTAEAGFHQYEISSFSLDGFECQHNIGYWTQVPYLGLGISAASMTGITSNSDGLSYNRIVNPDSFSAYENMVCTSEKAQSVRIQPSEARFETMMLGLRMNTGISEKTFFTMHGRSIDSCYGRKLNEMRKLGLLCHENGSWKMTPRGFDIQNSVLVELMDE